MQAIGEAIAARAAEEEGNAMKALENKTLDSRREMDIMAALDDLQTLNRRQARVDTDAALAALQRSAADDEDGGQVCFLPCSQSGKTEPFSCSGSPFGRPVQLHHVGRKRFPCEPRMCALCRAPR